MFMLCYLFRIIVVVSEIMSKSVQVDSIVGVEFAPDMLDCVCEVSGRDWSWICVDAETSHNSRSWNEIHFVEK